MKTTNKIISYVLAFITVFSSFTILPGEFFNWADVSAVDLTTEADKAQTISKVTNEEKTYIEDDFIYSIINENEVKIVGQNGTSTNLVIPSVTKGKQFSELANKKVTAIGDSAFTGKGLTSVTFGENLVTIGNNAFYQNKKLVDIDLSVCTGLKTIGDSAFYNCERLKSVIFPDSLEIIGDSAFYNCNYITKVETGSKLKSIGQKAFFSINSLYTVNIKGGQNAIIGKSAFAGCGIVQVTIGDGVEILDNNSFGGCLNLRKIDIGNTVTTIKSEAIELGQDYTHIIIGTGITTIEERGIFCDVEYYYIPGDYDDEYYMVTSDARVDIYGTELTNYKDNSMYHRASLSYIKCYCYKNSVTEKNLKPYIKNLNYHIRDTHLTDIKINGNSIDNFNEETKEYTTYIDGDITDVNMVPVFNIDNVSYKITSKNNIYTLNIYNELDQLINTYKVTVKKANYVFDAYPTNIFVNGVPIENFKSQTKIYQVYLEDVEVVAVLPTFKRADTEYDIKRAGNAFIINVYDANFEIACTYKVFIRKIGYSIIGDIELALEDIGSSKAGGSIALQPGTYKLKLALGELTLGYNKTITNTGSLKMSDKFNSFITLKASGGVYTFQFDYCTCELVIKHDSNLPKEYLVGDLNIVLTPLENRPLSIGTKHLPAGIYKFRVSIGGKEHGYNKVVNDSVAGSLTVNSKYSAYVTLNATGGMYTFMLNTDTNKLIIRSTLDTELEKRGVYIKGTFDLKINDMYDGEYGDIAEEIVYLKDGCYTFKINNYGVLYSSGVIFNNSGKRTLNTKYNTPIILNATGGYYKFVFNKKTYVFEVTLLPRGK